MIFNIEVARPPPAMLAHKEGDDQHLLQRGGRRQTVEVEEEEQELSELISKSSVLRARAASDDICGKFKKVPNNCAVRNVSVGAGFLFMVN